MYPLTAGRLRTLTVLAISVTTAITLTACSAGSTDSADPARADKASASPSPKGVVTVKQAESILDRYEVTNSKANKTQDGRLLGTVEAGQVHEQSLADYKQLPTWPKDEQADYEKPFTYTSRQYLIPASGQSWFAVKAKSSGTKSQSLLVFDKVGGGFKMVAAVWSPDPIPEIAVDRHGLATAVDPSKRVGSLAPNQVSAVYEDLYETGGAKDGARLASTRATKRALRTYQERDNGKAARWATKKYFATKPKHPQLYALRLADGGVLAVFPTAHNQELLLKPAYRSSFKIEPNEEEALYNPTGRSLITDEFQGQGIAELSPKGAIRVLAVEWQMVDSR